MQIVEERRKSQWARLSPYLEDYFVDASGDDGAVDVAFLMNHIDFAFEYLAASGFFPSVLALLGPLLCELSFHFVRSDSYGSTSTYSTLFDPL
jgi:hypothetical protein